MVLISARAITITSVAAMSPTHTKRRLGAALKAEGTVPPRPVFGALNDLNFGSAAQSALLLSRLPDSEPVQVLQKEDSSWPVIVSRVISSFDQDVGCLLIG